MELIIEKARELGISNTAAIKISDVVFSPELRKSCEANTCNNYGMNWKCPPAIGSAEECIERVKAFEEGILLQLFVYMKNSFDFEAMMEGAVKFKEILQELKKELDNSCEVEFLLLGAGGCNKCEKCAYLTEEPCRFPDYALSSVEAHGIYVSNTMKKAGMAYKDGENSISYVGLIAYNS